jgi:ADP-heptose:LPS heptosyltransferase
LGNKLAEIIKGFGRRIRNALDVYLFSRAVKMHVPAFTVSTKKIFISKHDSIGDFILFTAVLSEYRKVFPNYHIVLLVQDISYDLAETCPYVDEVWTINHLKFNRNFFERIRWYRKLSTAGFDVAINAVYSSFDTFDCLSGWTSAPRRIGFTCSSIIKRDINSLYFNELAPEREGTIFEMERNYDMLHFLGSPAQSPGKAELWIREADSALASKVKDKLKGKPNAIIFPGAGKDIRVWKSDKLIQTISEVSKLFPFHWIVCGGRAEKEYCAYITHCLEQLEIPVENYAGKTTLRELYCLFAGAALYIGNETMASHLAAATDTPAVCILGGAYYGRFYPYPNNPLTVAATCQMPCWGCNWDCIHKEAKCISAIKVEDVVTCVRKLLTR